MATADLEPVSVESRVAWFREHAQSTHPIWVAVAEDGHVAGWFSFQPFYGRCAYRSTVEVSVYVAPEDQRLGVARGLLEAAIARAPGLGYETLVGFVFGHNEPSLRLFESSGFARWGHLPEVARLDGVVRDLLIVGRRVA
jgi:L-amino acid N-acyltransferase YncA